jgi:hypothetical protein
MLAGMAQLGGVSEQPADLAGGQADQVAVVMIMLPGCRRKLSTGAGAPFELR